MNVRGGAVDLGPLSQKGAVTSGPGVARNRPGNDKLGGRQHERRKGTLDSGLQILEILATSANGGAGVTDLARHLGLDKGNVHRLLQVLRQRGYVQQDPETRHWSVTTYLLSLAGGILRTLDVRKAAEPEVRALLAASGQTAHLALRTRTGGIYVAQERPSGTVSVETDVGSAPVLHATATGKALLAWLSPAEWQALVHVPLERYTDRTITSVTELANELETIRTRGFALDDKELHDNVRCVAAPIFNHRNVVIASIGVSCPAEHMTRKVLLELGAVVRAAAARTTLALGGTPPAILMDEKAPGASLRRRS